MKQRETMILFLIAVCVSAAFGQWDPNTGWRSNGRPSQKGAAQKAKPHIEYRYVYHPEYLRQKYGIDYAAGNVRNERTHARKNPKLNQLRRYGPRVSTEQRMHNECMSMMHEDHMDGKMTPLMMSYNCHQYSKWCSAIAHPDGWIPSHKMMSWYSGLTTMNHGGKEKYYYGQAKQATSTRRRYPRQTAVRIRPEYRAMDPVERERFHRAVQDLKDSGRYDFMAKLHHPSRAMGAHFGPAFLGFHREYVLRFENALIEIDPEVTVPYWASHLDGYLGRDITESAIWSEDFLGNGDGQVTTGPFAGWSAPDGHLNRKIGGTPNPRAATPRVHTHSDLNLIRNAPNLESVTWFVDPTFESGHGSVHNFVSGTMGNLAISPFDPVFWLHHAFIDCLFEDMRTNQKARGVDVEYDFPNSTRALGVGMLSPDGSRVSNVVESHHYALNAMEPFQPLRNIDGLSNDYAAIYQCAPIPSCPNCGDALFCDESLDACVPMLRLGAYCARFSRYQPCYHGVCCGGICQASCDDRKADNGRSDLREEDSQVSTSLQELSETGPQLDAQPQPRQGRFLGPRPHPGVPTHAPFTMPTVPPVPTHSWQG